MRQTAWKPGVGSKVLIMSAWERDWVEKSSLNAWESIGKEFR
jgi:hypothetical protein